MTDFIHGRNPRERLESALARVVVAMTRLQQQRKQAQARYELLDRAGSEILATIDALTKTPAQPDTPAGSAIRQVKQVREVHSEAADAA